MEILHRDKWRELVRDCVVLHLVELVGVAAGHSDVSNVSSLDDVVQGLHRFSNRCVFVETMALENIDIVKLEAIQRMLDRFEYMLYPKEISTLANKLRINK